jgi:hypothetical protein
MMNPTSSVSFTNLSAFPPSYSEIINAEMEAAVCPLEKNEESKNQATPLRIIVLLDASGSMYSMRSEAIQAVNLFIKKQKELKANDEVVFDFFTFNSESQHLIVNKPISEVDPISEEKYVTEGSTSLYDTIGYVLDFYRDAHDVLLVIMTDGYDTSSKRYTNRTIKPLLAQRKISPFDWETVWLGADPTITQLGVDLGVAASVSVNFGMLREYSDQVFSSAVSEYRKERASGKRKAIDLKAQSEGYDI